MHEDAKNGANLMSASHLLVIHTHTPLRSVAMSLESTNLYLTRNAMWFNIEQN